MSSAIASGGNLASVSSLSYSESQADEPKQGSLTDTGRSGTLRGHTQELTWEGVITPLLEGKQPCSGTMRDWGIDVSANGNGGRASLRGDAQWETIDKHSLYDHKGSMIRPWTVWKHPKCPSTDVLIITMWDSHAMEYYLAVKKDKALIHATSWLNLENTMLSERSQT